MSPILHRLFPGGGAVLIFFVLSGLVLSMTYVYRDGDRFLSFLIKRVFRIWPPFAAAIVISALLRYAIGYEAVAGTTVTFAGNWSGPFSGAVVLSHLMMSGHHTTLDLPMWSLMQELRISVIFPIIVAIVIWDWRVALAASISACLLFAGIGDFTSLVDTVAPTIRFIPLFVMGAILALKVRELRHMVGSASTGVRLALWLICALGIAMSADYSGSGLSLVGSIRLMGHGMAAAGLVLLCATGGRVEDWLSARIPLFLGKISYSLYLIHVVLITAVVQYFQGSLPIPVLVISGAVLSIGVAVVMERYIEMPSARLGRRIANALYHRTSSAIT